MKLLFAILMGLAPAAFGEVRTENCGGYGPSPSNLTVLLDEEDIRSVLRVGYSIMGNFFELRVEGCYALTVEFKSILCDGRGVGRVLVESVAIDDPGYNGPRAFVNFAEGEFEVTGSCRPADGKPLTIRFQ